MIKRLKDSNVMREGRGYIPVAFPSLNKNIITNSLIFFGGNIANRLLNLAAFVLLTRYLGEEQWGIFNYAIVYVAFFAVFMELASENILIREVASNPSAINELVGTHFVLKLLLSLVSAILGVSSLWFIVSSYQTRIITIIMIGSLFFSFKMPGIKSTFDAIFKSKLDVRIPIIWETLSSFIFFVGVLLLPVISASITIISILYVVCWIPGLVGIAIYVYKIIPFTIKLNQQLLFYFLRQSLPVMVTALVSLMAKRLDVFLLTYFRDYKDVGLYSAAYRLSEPLYFISVAIVVSLFPLMSSNSDNKSGQSGEIYRLGVKIVMIIIMPLMLLIYAYAPFIIHFLYGDTFAPSIPSLQILIFSQVFTHFSVIASHYLLSQKKQTVNLYSIIVMAIVSLGINLWLIPIFGFIGASFAIVGTEVSGALLFGMLTWKELRFFDKKSLVLIMVMNFILGVTIYFTNINVLSALLIPFFILYGYIVLFGPIFSEPERLLLRLSK